MLRWTSIPNANTYRVTVRGDEGSWSATVTGRPGLQIQEMIYPQPCGPVRSGECAPPLTPGQSYKLIVEANNSSSEEEDLPNLGFTLLRTEDIQRLERLTNGLNHLAIASPLKTKALASLYANNGLNADAIRVLEDDSISQQNPEAVRLLGNLYLRIGLPRKAETWYLKLLETTLTTLDTPTGRAITNQTLAEIYELLGNRDEAVRYYRIAKSIYRALSDQESTSKIESRLAALGVLH
jgi:tetratricopeptide (TPR) repeat protein